ncbi:ABC transporter permease [Chloroflexota bacterium]
MKFIDSIIIAIRSLFTNKLRSALTMLGVIIGVGSVITLMSVGRGAEAQITATIEDLGSNSLSVISQTPGVSGLAALQSATPSLTLKDTEEILQRVPSVTSVAPVSENYVEVAFGDESALGVVEGTTPEFSVVYSYNTISGRSITDRDIATRATVVVLGAQVAKDLFGDADPVGERVKISGKRFTVIGLLEEKGGQMMGVSMDSIIIVPITTYQARLFPRQTTRGEDAVQSIAVQITDAKLADVVSDDITKLLRKRHHIEEGDDSDFTIFTQEQLLSTFQQITGIFTIILGAIASISLVVGSIGIMNIMLVSVTERTREIGIRKAVGAKRRDILVQFLFEAAVISLAGGIVGILGGSFLSVAIAQVSAAAGQALETKVTWDIIILAFSVSLFIGLVSGIYPAMRAARLNPIDALHYG